MRTVATILLLSVVAVSAQAHKLNVFATVGDGKVTGRTYFPNAPAEGLTVELRDASNKVIEQAISGKDGAFAFEAVIDPPVTLVSETKDGHRAEFRIEAQEGYSVTSNDPAHHDASPDEEIIREIIQQELAPIRGQLDAQSNQIRVRDIIGGIGYVVGVFGVVALLKRRAPRA